MKILRHVGLIVILLMGFSSNSESALIRLPTLEDLSEYDRTLVRRLFTEDMEAQGSQNIAIAFKRIPADQIDSIVENTLRLRTPQMEHEDICDLMSAISYLSDRETSLELVQKLIPIIEEEPPYRLVSLLSSFRSLDDKRNFVDLLSQSSLFSKERSAEERKLRINPHRDLLYILSGVSEDNRKNIVAWAERICGSDADSREKAEVVSLLSKFSSCEERDKFMGHNLVKRLLSCYENEKGKLISLLRNESNEDDRNNILEFLSSSGFISPEISFSLFWVLLTEFSRLSSVDREAQLECILESNILTPTMAPSERGCIVEEILYDRDPLYRYGEPDKFKRRLMALAVSFITPETTAQDRAEIVRILKRAAGSLEMKDLLVSYASQLCTASMTSHDRLDILYTLGRDAESRISLESLRYHFEFASAYLHEASLQGLITQDNIFAWTRAFLEEAHRVGPGFYPVEGLSYSIRRAGAPINIIRGAPIQFVDYQDVVNIDVVGQEAISAQRRAIKETYDALATTKETATVISRNLPSLGTENEVFGIQTTKLTQALEFLLKTQRLSAVQKMKLINALLGMSILTDQSDPVVIKRIRELSPETHIMVDQLIGQDNTRQIPRHGISNAASYRRYSHSDLPNIRQFFVLIYNLLDQQMGAPVDPKGFTRCWLAETFANDPGAWGKFKRAFEHDFHITLPRTVGEALEHQPFLENHLVSCLESLLKDEELSESTHSDLQKAIQKLAKSYGEAHRTKYTPLIEALAMIMRGHNENLDSWEEQNHPACAEGAYLGLIKVLQEIPNVQHIVGNSLAHIDVVACGGVARPAMPDISTISLGAVQEDLDQTRALRAAQDAAYAASLAADQARDQLREEQESPQPAAAAETRQERGARLAAAAEARRGNK